MIINELVTLLRFEMPPGSKTALQNSEKGVDGLSKMFSRLDPTSKKLAQSLGSIGAKLTSIGIGASVAGSGLMAALGAMTISESKQADQLMKLSGVLGTNADELSLWSAAITSAGGNASAFLSDIQKLKQTWPDFSLDDVLEAANELASLPEMEVFPRGAAMGYGEDSVRFMRQGAEGIRAALAEAQRLGQGSLQKHLEDLQKVHQKYSSLGETFDGIRERFAGDLAPGVGRALDLLNESFAANSETIDGWAKSLNDTLNAVLDGIEGRFQTIDERISRFNGEKSIDNASSADPEIRQKELNERIDTARWKQVGVLWSATAGIIGNMLSSTGSRKKGHDILVKGYENYLKAGEEVDNAVWWNKALERNDNSTEGVYQERLGALSELSAFHYRDPSKALDMADPYSPQAMQESLEQMYGPRPSRVDAEDLRQTIKGMSVVRVPVASEGKAFSGPVGGAYGPQSIGGNDSGVIIEHQSVEINNYGVADPLEATRMTVAQLENAAKQGDNIRFFH